MIGQLVGLTPVIYTWYKSRNFLYTGLAYGAVFFDTMVGGPWYQIQRAVLP